MILDDIFESAPAVRKTVWSKRGTEVTRREVETVAPDSIRPRTKIQMKEPRDADAN